MNKRIFSGFISLALAASAALQASAAELRVPEDELAELCRSNYAYNDFDNSTDPEARKELYNRVFQAYKELWNSDETVPASMIIGGDHLLTTVQFSDLGLSNNDAVDVFYSFCNDNPLFYYANRLLWSGGGKLFLSVNEKYADPAAREAMQKKIIDYLTDKYELVDGLKSEYKIAKVLHDALIEDAEYAYMYIDGVKYADTGDAYQSIEGIINEGKGVCASYTSTYQLLLNYAGVECAWVDGIGKSSIGEGAHAWNAVKLDDGNFYGIDVTWDDTANTTNYFARGSAFFNVTHIAKHPPADETEIYDNLGYYFVAPVLAENDYDPSYVRPEIIPGDANGDKKVNMLDYAIMQRYLTGSVISGIEPRAFDINNDGNINMLDYAAMQRLLLNAR